MRKTWQSRLPDKRRKSKKERNNMNAVMQKFAKAWKDSCITRKKAKRSDGSSLETFNVEEDFNQLAVTSGNDLDDSDE